jgi:hypothetical protein
MQMPAPKGTTTPDKAIPSRSSATYGNIRITLQRAAPMGGTRAAGLRLR